MHVLLIAHGRQTCRARNPKCLDCDLLPLCPFGKKCAPQLQAQEGRGSTRA